MRAGSVGALQGTGEFTEAVKIPSSDRRTDDRFCRACELAQAFRRLGAEVDW